MADFSSRPGTPPILRVAGAPGEPLRDSQAIRTAAIGTAGSVSKNVTIHTHAEVNNSPDPVGLHVMGLVLSLCGALLCVLPIERWASLVAWGPGSWAAESGRWITAGVLILSGLSTLRSRPIFVVLSAALFVLVAYGCDALLNWRASNLLNGVARSNIAGPVAILAAAAFAYLVHVRPTYVKLPLRGIFGLVIVVLACVGTMRGWFNWTAVAARLGPGPASVVAKWGEECTWATVLVLTAIGVSCSRSRPICFLNAFLLAALAYYCIKSGFTDTKVFAGLAKDGIAPTIEFVTYKNVELWRWVVGAELACLALVLLHMAMGVGGLCIAFALSLMIAGFTLDRSVGRMVFVRGLIAEGSLGAASRGATNPATPNNAAPLSNMGLPIAPPVPQANNSGQPIAPGPNTAGPSPAIASSTQTAQSINPASAAELARLREKAIASRRQSVIGAALPLGWLAFTALGAGLIAAVGLHLLIAHAGIRFGVMLLLMLAFLLGTAGLWYIWPRDPNQSWEQWWSAWRLSRYHVYGIWLAFMGSMAVFALGALHAQSRTSTWIHAAAAASFVGTAATLVAAQMMIQFGGFPLLPPWVYAAIAAGQSSLGWILLAHQNFSARRAGPIAALR